MPERVIAVEFDADLVPARELARAIHQVAELIDRDASTCTQSFRPTDWPKSEALITIVER